MRFALREVTPHSPDSANPEFVSITRNERVLGLPPGRAHAPYAELILGTKQMREYMDPEQFMIQVLDESIEMVSSQLNRTTSVRAGLKVKKASFMRLPGVYRTQVAQLLEAIFGSRE